MANSLNIDLRGKTVKFKKGVLKPKYENLTAVVDKDSGGFGAVGFTAGTALFVTFSDGEKARMDGYDVLEIVEK